MASCDGILVVSKSQKWGHRWGKGVGLGLSARRFYCSETPD